MYFPDGGAGYVMAATLLLVFCALLGVFIEKKMLGAAKTRIGALSLEDGASLIFHGENELPSHQPVLDFFHGLAPSAKKLKLPVSYVIREFCHLEGWIESFLRVERRDLDARFGGGNKSYESWVIGDRSLSEVDIIVHLKTAGLGGYTEYRISIVKIDEDDFLCVE